jgi:hypothetical protein
MVRTIVYDSPQVQAHYLAEAPANLGLVAPRARRTLRVKAEQAVAASPPALAAADQSKDTQPKDTVPTKLIKYVPAEVVTVTAGGFAAFNPSGDWIWASLAFGALVNVLYLFTTTASDSKAPRPRIYFYPLSALAYVVWAIATIASVQKAMSLTTDKAAYILVVGTFAIPLLDSFFTVVEGYLPGVQNAAA